MRKGHMTELAGLSATHLAALYRSRAVSPVEVTEQVLALAERSARTINAFCCIDREAALEQARASEARWLAATPRGPLDGMPVSVKDNIGVHGMPTRFGSLAVDMRHAHLPDSPAVMRLREAGAVMFGKTTLPDFAHKIVTDSPLTGVTRNPWHLDHTPGGSSGGAAAAVAAGIGPLALGTDGGGSIRIPAAFTGAFGFKPSFGRVPHYPRGAFALLSHVGPITRTVADAALMMNTISRPDARDWYALPYHRVDHVKQLRRSLSGLRIAYSESLGLPVGVDGDVAAAVQRAAQAMEALGAAVERADPPAISRCHEIHSVLWTSFSARLAETLGERRSQLDASLQALVEAGERLPHNAFLNALVARAEAGKDINEFFALYDLVVCPVHSTFAPALAELQADAPPFPQFTPWCNQLGLPAASVYCGLSATGLPLGVQIVGRQFADSLVLSACHAFEQAQGQLPRASLQRSA